MFPTINHIDDVLPFVKDKDEFAVIDKGDYTIIDYVCNFPDTFPGKEDPNWMIFRECRGIAFDSQGNLISRPLHKFFNYSEKPQEDAQFDWSSAKVYEKLDGSMIRPLYINGNWRLATRKGITDVAMQAENFLERSGLKNYYFPFFAMCERNKVTPVFEWCSRENRVVIDHPVDRLVLLCVRSLKYGYYEDLSPRMLKETFKLELVDSLSLDTNNILNLLETVKGFKDQEGIVVRNDSGASLKIKAEEYVLLHRTKSMFDNERNIIGCIVEGTIDDLRPLLSPNQLERLDKYETAFHSGLSNSVDIFKALLNEAKTYLGKEKRDYAVNFVLKQPKSWHPILFSVWDNFDIGCEMQYLLKFVKYANSQQVKDSKWLFGAEWI